MQHVAKAARIVAWLLPFCLLTIAAPAAALAPPPVNAQFDYQIGGAYEPAAGVQIVERDRLDQPDPGRYNICYLNAFQTQPGTKSWWKRKHPKLLLRKRGRLVVDSNWGEILLNTATPAKRKKLTRIVNRWVRTCASRGYDAVELDNLDSFGRSRGRLSMRNNLDLARRIVRRAHARDLAVAQKNTVELGGRGARIAKFDFAIAEECQRYSECGRYLRVYGHRVIEVEYTDYPRTFFDAACAARGGQISIILRDRDVVPVGVAGYRYESC